MSGMAYFISRDTRKRLLRLRTMLFLFLTTIPRKYSAFHVQSILNLAIREKCEVSFTVQLFYPL
jgi:hypothetical protein